MRNSSTPVTPALCGAEAERIAQVRGHGVILRLQNEFKASPRYLRRHCLTKEGEEGREARKEGRKEGQSEG